MIVPCPYCKTLPCIVEDKSTKTLSIGCRQAFIRRTPDEPECTVKPTFMCVPNATKKAVILMWNSWCFDKKAETES